MKIAIAGKGGVGKTTISALICWALNDKGSNVLAVDADPDTNLGSVLGFPLSKKITPIIKMKELVEERMGVREGNRSLFKLNPKVDDIPDKFMREHHGVKLIVMGTIEGGDSGCACPENTFLKRLLHQIALRANEHIVVDFEAGVEHLGRGTAEKFDHLLIVVEPTNLSLDSFDRILPLARDIGIKKIWVIANRIKTSKDVEFVRSRLGKEVLLGSVSFSPACSEASQSGNWEILKQDKIYQDVGNIVKSLLIKE